MQELPDRNARSALRTGITYFEKDGRFMDLTSMFSDDQIAILGCFGALAVCGMVAAISFQFGPAGRNSTAQDRTPLKLKVPSQPSESTDKRKAA